MKLLVLTVVYLVLLGVGSAISTYIKNSKCNP